MQVFVVPGVIVVLIAMLVALFFASYLKAPPDTAYIISGFRNSRNKAGTGKKPRIVIGRSALRIPFLERVDKMPLGLMQVDIKSQDPVPTTEFINIFVDGVANIKVDSRSDESILRAAEQFLGKKQDYIAETAQQVLEGNMREIIGQMALQDLVHNRDTFAQKVRENAAEEMNRMGLEIVNLTIQNFNDRNQVLENLGIDNISKISKEAAIAKATAERDVAIAKAAADEASNEARAKAQIQIASQNKDVSIKESEFQIESDTKKAEADAAYSIQEQQQRRSIETASVSADIARKEKEIELKQREAEVKEQTLAAEVRKQAEADRYKKEQEAEADKYRRSQEAEARKVELEREAEAKKIMADADLYAAQQDAAGIKARGEAEAEAIQLKAEAMKKMGEASVLEMYLKVLPDIVKNAAEPLAQTKEIVMYGEGNAAKLTQDVMATTRQITDGIEGATGVNIGNLLSGFVGGKAAIGAASADVSEKAESPAPKRGRPSSKKE